jgi:hypothetical protein
MTSSRLTVALLVCLAACSDVRRSALTGPSDALTPIEASIGISNLHPAPGQTVVLTVHVATTAATAATTTHPAASFVADLDYDSTALVFNKEVPLSGATRAMNRHNGRLIVAGATSGGFTDGRLFSAAFHVVNPAGLGTVRLTIREMTDTGFRSTLHRLAIDQSLRQEATAQ